jgi:hypothetical protein
MESVFRSASEGKIYGWKNRGVIDHIAKTDVLRGTKHCPEFNGTPFSFLQRKQNRKKDQPPGPRPFWIAIRRMYDLAIAYQTFGP